MGGAGGTTGGATGAGGGASTRSGTGTGAGFSGGGAFSSFFEHPEKRTHAAVNNMHTQENRRTMETSCKKVLTFCCLFNISFFPQPHNNVS